MPDPEPQRGAYFRLRETVEIDGKQKEFAIYGSAGKTEFNYVILRRNGFHECQFCIGAAEAKKIFERKINLTEGLEAVIFDDRRVPDLLAEDPEADPATGTTEIRLWPLVPVSMERIDSLVVKAKFRVAWPVLNGGDSDAIHAAWDYTEDTENSYDVEGILSEGGLGWGSEGWIPEHHVYLDLNTTPTSWAGRPIAADVPVEVLDAMKVGTHLFIRPKSIGNYARMLAAITGTVWWTGTDDAEVHLALAGEPQDGIADILKIGTRVREMPNFPNEWNKPALLRNGMYYRRSASESVFQNFPQRSIYAGFGGTLPTYYVSPLSVAGQIPVSHYSTLLFGALSIPNALSSPDPQAAIDAHAEAWERCVKAVERTINQYAKASRRTDWYVLDGYYEIPLGSEVAEVTYKKGKTMVDFRETAKPLWPRIPMASTPILSTVKATITSKINTSTFTATIAAAHAGKFGNSTFSAIGRTWTLEEPLGRYPWLDVGDTVLAIIEGDRGVIVDTQLVLDTES
jgi:hypothetical protein